MAVLENATLVVTMATITNSVMPAQYIRAGLAVEAMSIGARGLKHVGQPASRPDQCYR